MNTPVTEQYVAQRLGQAGLGMLSEFEPSMEYPYWMNNYLNILHDVIVDVGGDPHIHIDTSNGMCRFVREHMRLFLKACARQPDIAAMKENAAKQNEYPIEATAGWLDLDPFFVDLAQQEQGSGRVPAQKALSKFIRKVKIATVERLEQMIAEHRRLHPHGYNFNID